MTNNIFTGRDRGNIYTVMAAIKDGRSLPDALADYAVENGKDREDAGALTTQIMTSVNDYEDFRENFSSRDTERRMQSFFRLLETKTPQQQMEILDQISFALSSVSDDALFSEIRSASDGNKVYLAHRDRVPEYTPENYEAQKASLLNKIENMNLSPKAFKRMVSGLRRAHWFGNYTATAAAFGRDGYELKCVSAMILHLRGGEDADLNQDVVKACASVDIQAVGDAVYRGIMTRQAAESCLYTVLIISFAAVMAGTMFSVAFAPNAIVAILSIVFGYCIMDGIASTAEDTNELATLLGRVSVSLSNLIQKGHEAVDKGLDSLYSYVERKHLNNDDDIYDEDFDTDSDYDTGLVLMDSTF